MAEDTDPRVQLAALAAELAALRAQLDETRTGLDQTLRGQRRCRACGGQAVFHATEVADRYGESGNFTMALAIRVNQKTFKTLGAFEVYVCERCGLVEWYVKRPAELVPDGEKLLRHEEPPKRGGPYR